MVFAICILLIETALSLEYSKACYASIFKSSRLPWMLFQIWSGNVQDQHWLQLQSISPIPDLPRSGLLTSSSCDVQSTAHAGVAQSCSFAAHRCDSETGNITSTREGELVRNTSSQSLLQTSQVRKHILTSSPGNSCTRERMSSAVPQDLACIFSVNK